MGDSGSSRGVSDGMVASDDISDVTGSSGIGLGVADKEISSAKVEPSSSEVSSSKEVISSDGLGSNTNGSSFGSSSSVMRVMSVFRSGSYSANLSSSFCHTCKTNTRRCIKDTSHLVQGTWALSASS
jgi:hypothetical protein